MQVKIGSERSNVQGYTQICALKNVREDNCKFSAGTAGQFR
jgi:hypothetical protein